MLYIEISSQAIDGDAMKMQKEKRLIEICKLKDLLFHHSNAKDIHMPKLLSTNK